MWRFSSYPKVLVATVLPKRSVCCATALVNIVPQKLFINNSVSRCNSTNNIGGNIINYVDIPTREDRIKLLNDSNEELDDIKRQLSNFKKKQDDHVRQDEELYLISDLAGLFKTSIISRVLLSNASSINTEDIDQSKYSVYLANINKFIWMTDLMESPNSYRDVMILRLNFTKSQLSTIVEHIKIVDKSLNQIGGIDISVYDVAKLAWKKRLVQYPFMDCIVNVATVKMLLDKCKQFQWLDTYHSDMAHHMIAMMETDAEVLKSSYIAYDPNSYKNEDDYSTQVEAVLTATDLEKCRSMWDLWNRK